MRYRAVLFDMDGTVLDTLGDIADSLNYSLGQFSLPQVSEDQVRRSLGNGAGHLVDCCVPQDLSESRKAEFLAFYKSWYDAHCSIRTQPYDGIPELMRALKDSGVKLAIVSNKPDFAVRELAEQFFPGLLEFSVGESPSVRRKPCPDTVLAAAEAMSLSVSDCVYIGDSEVDIETGRNAGMDYISVAWGFRTEPELLAAGAGTIAHSVEELKRLL